MGRRPYTQAQKDANKLRREEAARAKSAKAGAAARRALLAMQPRQASEEHLICRGQLKRDSAGGEESN